VSSTNFSLNEAAPGNTLQQVTQDESSYRLLQVFNRAVGHGGEAVAADSIAAILAKSCEFRECCFSSKEWSGPGAPPVWKQALSTYYNPNSVRRLRGIQSEFKAQAWIVQNFVPIASPGVHIEALRQKIPIIQFVHNFRPYSVASYSWDGTQLDPRHWPKNFLIEIRRKSWQESTVKTALLASVFTAMHIFRLFRAVRAWVAVSDFMRREFIRAGVPPDNIFRIYNPWTLQNVDPLAGTESDYYIFLGRLMEEKGVKVLVKAWECLRQALGAKCPRLVIGGEGPLTEWVKEAAKTNPLISYRGFLSGAEKAGLLRGCRGLIAPSIWGEALGLIVYEAYDFEKPVLAASSGGLTETVQHGVTGLLHRAGDAEQLARQVVDLDSNSQRRRSMGEAGRRWLIQNTNEDVWKQQFFEVVRRVTAGPSR
jgi:glycosyltransferase involved in cell wall biosynthesis